MKKVVRYKCDYCKKLAVKPETIEHHEKECIKNPESRNCYLCVHSIQGGYVDTPYDGEKFAENIPYCGIRREQLGLLREYGCTALNCKYFERDDKMYWEKQAER